MNSDQVSRDDSCSLVISRGTEGDGYTRGYNNNTSHIIKILLAWLFVTDTDGRCMNAVARRLYINALLTSFM